MNNPASRVLTFNGYTIRRLDTVDAVGVSRLVETVYGDSYYPRSLYDPARILRLNQEGALVSIVALDAAGEVVGHCALERPNGAAVAELSDAIVHPSQRHHHLLDEMHVLLDEEAAGLELTGIVIYPVTNHIFSQKADEHAGAHPCGVALGLWPESFHNMPEALPQRMSFVIYFKQIGAHDPTPHVATHHHEISARIYQQFGIPFELRESAPAEGEGEITVDYESPVQAAYIQVRRVGADTVAAVRRARRDLIAGSGAKAITLELPLAQAATAEVCRGVEQDGFFFCGLGPAFAGDGDALLLQFIEGDLDLSLVQIENPFTKQLLAYVESERERVKSL